MRPREQSRGQEDLFRSRLDQIINMNHELVRLGRQIDWRLIGNKLGEVYTDEPGQPPLPTRLMAGMAILKHMHDLSDEAVPPSRHRTLYDKSTANLIDVFVEQEYMAFPVAAHDDLLDCLARVTDPDLHLKWPEAGVFGSIRAKFEGLRTRNSRQAGQLPDDCGQRVKSG